MKNISLYSLIIIGASFNAHIQCSEHNNHIGQIDKLMIARSITEKGLATFEREIHSHQFTITVVEETFPPQYFTKPNPFCIMHFCIEKDGSQLSDNVFYKIRQKTELDKHLKIHNPLNRHANSIDQCTIWGPIIGSKNVYARATFYDKPTLVAALNQLKNEK